MVNSFGKFSHLCLSKAIPLFRPETLSKHVVNYSPSRKGKPFIEGEAEIGGSTRKASVGIVGSSLGNMNQVVGIPKAGLQDY